MSKLNAKQEKFVHEYLKTLNITQAAIKAGYSKNSAHVTGSRLLKEKKIADYVQAQKDKVLDENILEAKELLHLISNGARGEETEIKEVVVKKGEYVKNPDTERYNVIYNEHVELVEVPIKSSDVARYREMLGKYHKIFTEKVDINAGLPVFVDTTGTSMEERQEVLNRVHEKYPNNVMIHDDID